MHFRCFFTWPPRTRSRCASRSLASSAIASRAASWRRVSFRLQDDVAELDGVVQHRRVRAEHQVITHDAPATLQQLTEQGAEAVEVSRMSVDEIAVQILKEGHRVARAAS